MYKSTPRLEIYLQRIEENTKTITGLVHHFGGTVACVTKVVCAHHAVINALFAGGADMFADSRIANLQSLGGTGKKLQTMMLRIPAPSEAAQIVQCADYSLNSSVMTIKKLSAAAVIQEVIHSVIIMVDVGDLREGVWPDVTVNVVREVAHLPNINVEGLGCNLACFGGVIPSQENMQILIDVRDECRRVTGLELPTISGGNSASLPLIASGKMPKEINHFRIGEAIMLGRNVIDRRPWPETYQDTFRIVCEVIEVERKPSIPIGVRGQDAFGETGEFIDRGVRRRAICNIGRQDVVVDGITPEDKGIIVLGGSSDHLILDIEDAEQNIAVGSEIAFTPGYGALLAASTSPYVQKLVIEE